MKKHWMGLLALTLVGSGVAGDEIMVKVTGDRVSLRALPEINSVLLDRAMSGDLLVLKDNTNQDWVGVVPPSEVDVWVHREFIENGQVLPTHLNVRSGPSLNHSVVGAIDRGDAVRIRGEAGGWLRIAPPEKTVVWISRKYTDIAAETNQPAEIIEEQLQPEIDQMMAAATDVPDRPEILAPDPAKIQGVKSSFSGVLLPATGLLYKLVDADVNAVTICYVRGNATQMLELKGQALTITGKTYWALDLDMPFIRPEKIKTFKSLEGM